MIALEHPPVQRRADDCKIESEGDRDRNERGGHRGTAMRRGGDRDNRGVDKDNRGCNRDREKRDGAAREMLQNAMTIYLPVCLSVNIFNARFEGIICPMFKVVGA